MTPEQKRAVKIMLAYWAAQGAFLHEAEAISTCRSIATAINLEDGSHLTAQEVAAVADELKLRPHRLEPCNA